MCWWRHCFLRENKNINLVRHLQLLLIGWTITVNEDMQPFNLERVVNLGKCSVIQNIDYKHDYWKTQTNKS